MATYDPAISAAWFKRLGGELDRRQGQMQLLEEYYRGNHPLLYASSRFRAAFGNMFMGFSDNWCGIVVDALEERLDIDGFRMSSNAGDAADDDAWRIWQANAMDANSQMAHSEALTKGYSYVLVWNDPDHPEIPLITVEDAREMVVAVDRGSRKRLAALKRWVDDDDSKTVYATLYLPDRIEKWVSAKGQTATSGWQGPKGYAPRQVEGESWPLENPLGVVPVVPLINRPNLRGRGESELKEIVPIQNAVNKLTLDMLVAAEFAAYRQRWVTGMDIPIDPDTQKPVEPFKSAVDRMFVGEDKDTKFGQFDVTELGNYTGAIDKLIGHIASITRTPSHYFMAGASGYPSGETLKAAETGLVRKAWRRERYFGEGWEEVMRLAFAVLDDPRSEILDSETMWRNAESRNDAVLADMAVKLGSAPIEIPQEMLWEMIGLTPKQIERAKALRKALEEQELPDKGKPTALALVLPSGDTADVEDAADEPDAAAPAAPGAPMPPAAGGGRNGMPVMAVTGAPAARAPR